jgi:predicted enzyme related to lactoylglutathione lyase
MGILIKLSFENRIYFHAPGLRTPRRYRHPRPGVLNMFLGLRTVIYKVDDMNKARSWYERVLGISPYFDEPFYIGFSPGGYELGLVPDINDIAPGKDSLTYWGVADIEVALAVLKEQGASESASIQDVGGGIKTATIISPFGNVIGIIENPHFKLPE